ncbi:MAG: tol-pal system protein YbgF [Deltaproteobacteria bacterium]|nr:tol-pal system protein YbgF [Deltaproteobacteria bacterium]
MSEKIGKSGMAEDQSNRLRRFKDVAKKALMSNMHSRSIILYLLLPLLYVSGCIAIESKDYPVKKDINILRQDLTTQQQRIDSLLEAIKKETAGIEQEVRNQKSEIVRIDEYVQKGRADVNVSADRIREDIAFLRGKFEEVDHAVKKANKDTVAVQEKIDSKLQTHNSELNNRLLSLQNQLAALGKRLSSLDEKVVSLEHARASSMSEEVRNQADLPAQADKQEAEPPKPDELYNEAMKLTKDKDNSNALLQFGRFLSLFPGHVLASNAQYWTGEIYYRQKDYERAVLEFNEVLKKYPKSNKVPAALLKQGMAFSELGNKKEARLVLEKVVDKYPKTEEADRAKKMLREVK